MRTLAVLAALAAVLYTASAVQINLDQGHLMAGEHAAEHGGKSSWPELVGQPVDKVVDALKAETGLNVIPIPQDRVVTMDFSTQRIRVFYDSERKVSRPPRIG